MACRIPGGADTGFKGYAATLGNHSKEDPKLLTLLGLDPKCQGFSHHDLSVPDTSTTVINRNRSAYFLHVVSVSIMGVRVIESGRMTPSPVQGKLGELVKGFYGGRQDMDMGNSLDTGKMFKSCWTDNEEMFSKN